MGKQANLGLIHPRKQIQLSKAQPQANTPQSQPTQAHKTLSKSSGSEASDSSPESPTSSSTSFSPECKPNTIEQALQQRVY